MKKFAVVFVALLCYSILAFSQEIEQNLSPFTRIVASPRIHVILNKGEKESIRLVYSGVSAHKINIKASGKTLRLFLDGARKFERKTPSGMADGRKESMYKDAIVTAYVTYRELDMLEIRGDQELTCNDPIHSEQFTLRAYGENEVTLAFLSTDFFRAKLYGENRLSVKNGKATEQQYSLYGENRIDTRALRSKYTSAHTFGENSLRVSCREEMRIHAFGEPEIRVDGGAQISSRLVIGKASIERD